MKYARLWLVVAALGAVAGEVRAQNNDFFNRGGVALFEPEIGVVNSGSSVVMAPVVSADRKYVTIGARAQTARVIRIETFPFFTGGFAGPVGNAQPAAVAAPGAEFAEAMFASAPVVVREAVGRNVLNLTGMVRVE